MGARDVAGGEPSAPMDAAGFREHTGVSRETSDRLALYADLLAKWQRRINLVGPKTLPDVWRRHMLDSAQLHPLLPDSARTVADLGSGAGFPGLVLAALDSERAPELRRRIHLIESDTRKAAFLREAARQMGLSDRVSVHARRIDALEPFAVDVVTARALAPVGTLLDYARRLTGGTPLCLFLKGKRLEGELTDAKSAWYLKYSLVPSVADPSGTILTIEDFADVRSDPG